MPAEHAQSLPVGKLVLHCGGSNATQRGMPQATPPARTGRVIMWFRDRAPTVYLCTLVIAVVLSNERVRAYTGLDLFERGYQQHAEHRRFPPDTSGEIRRELRQMQREHDREIEALERELDRKLDKARAEFEREAAREDKPGKVRQKRRRLEEKVNAAYAGFDDKVSAINARSDEKRERILSKARGKGDRQGRGDKGRGPPDERGRGRSDDGNRGDGHGLDDLKL